MKKLLSIIKIFFFYLIQVVACCNFELFCELIKPNDLYPNQNRVITDKLPNLGQNHDRYKYD